MTAPGHPHALLEALSNSHAEACAATGTAAVRRFRIAGHVIELRYACTALDEALSPAITHAETTASTEPDLSVSVWESRQSGMDPPVMPWSTRDLATISRRAESIPRLYFDDGRCRFISTRHRNLLAYDASAARAVFWVADAADLMQWERAAPLRLLLQMYFAGRNVELVHAAAVGDERGAVLLTGPSGSGKSTTSLLCLDAGLRFCSDDYCALDADDPAAAHSVYTSAKLLPDSLKLVDRFGPGQVHFHREDSPKGLVYVGREQPEAVLDSAPVRAVVGCVVVGGTHSRLASASRGSVLRALAPSSLLQGPGDKQRSLSFMTRLVRRCPAYRLELGTDIDRIPRLVSDLLERTRP